MNEEAKGRGGGSKVITNPFDGIAPLPVAVPPDPLSGLMAMEAEDENIFQSPSLDFRGGAAPL